MVKVSKKRKTPEQNPDPETETEDEEEDEEEDERKRRKLLEAVRALGGQRKKSLLERSEAAASVSEFTVSSVRVDLSELVGTINKAPGVTARNRKQLRELQRGACTEDSPLTRQESERIQRGVAFEKAACAVSRWSNVIRQNQKAEQLIFPLDQEPGGPRPVEQMALSWKAQTPLEQEVFAVLSANKQPINDPVLTPCEEASLRAMSLEEAQVRRAELQKARALQSYYEAKARRGKKIKSKKYHKVQNKARRKDMLKRFDELVKTDPSGALEELERVERRRMEERMSLKHQNSGKWAKSKAIMAKYDHEARKAMQQQLEVHKDLTLKVQSSLMDQEEEKDEEQEEEEENLPDFVNDLETGWDSNPWMKGKLTEEPVEEKNGGEQEEKDEQEEKEEEEEVGEEEALLREFDSKRKQRQEAAMEDLEDLDHEDDEQDHKEEEQEEDQEHLSEFRKLFQEKVQNLEEKEREEPLLQEALTRIRTLEDLDSLPQDDPISAPENPSVSEPPPPPAEKKQKKKKKRTVELTEVLTKEATVVQVPVKPTVEDSEDHVDQQELIREAFAGDDVVSDFLRDKKKQENSGKPKTVDLVLPGWGEWGGQGVQPSKIKRRRFRIPAAPPPPRKDQHLPSVIISERRNSAMTAHQVSALPYPFQNQDQFQSAIRCPLGRTWNTERTVKKATRPRVVSRLGTIIQPMAEEQLKNVTK